VRGEVLRAGVIGLGVGEQHIAGYEAHPGAEVAAICDLDPDRLEEVGRRHPGPRRTTRPEHVLHDPEIDVVSIATYDDAHFPQIYTALAGGKHVFAEKPLVTDRAEAEAIVALLDDDPRLRISTNVPLRLSPRFVRLRELIAQGQLGELFHLEGDYDYGRRHKLTDGWRGRIPHYSVLLGGGIHMIDLLRWLSGLEIAEVVGAAESRIATRGTAFRHPDFVTATLRTTTGATMKVNANLGCVSPHFHAVRVYGTVATFVNGLPDGQLHKPAPQGATTERITDPYPGVAKSALVTAFVDAIHTRTPGPVDERAVFATLSACLAIEDALRSGSRTDVRHVLPSPRV
jgi:predicted dehydrogenase